MSVQLNETATAGGAVRTAAVVAPTRRSGAKALSGDTHANLDKIE
jgi:hypothetical protein